MFNKGLMIISILLFTFTATASSTVKINQAKISGTVVKVGQGADIVQSRIHAAKYVPGSSYGEESKGYYIDGGTTYIITYGPPSSGEGAYVIKRIEKIIK